MLKGKEADDEREEREENEIRKQDFLVIYLAPPDTNAVPRGAQVLSSRRCHVSSRRRRAAAGSGNSSEPQSLWIVPTAAVS